MKTLMEARRTAFNMLEFETVEKIERKMHCIHRNVTVDAQGRILISKVLIKEILNDNKDVYVYGEGDQYSIKKNNFKKDLLKNKSFFYIIK